MQHQELLDLLLKAVDIVRADMAPEPVVAAPEPVVAAPEPVVAAPEITFESLTIDKSLFPAEVHPLLDLLVSEEWPEAAPSFLICEESEDDKIERAEGILDYIGDSLFGKKVLDFGCGEGHVALKASETAATSVGYDILKTGNLSWEADNTPVDSGTRPCLLTTDFSKVTTNGPYDLIILYDVLDHCVDPAATMVQVRTLCGPNTKLFIRCHSWMSRHGGHLYRQINKAWVHLFFTEEELHKMGVQTEFVQKVFFPIRTQFEWFSSMSQHGFKIGSSDVIKGVVEPFFRRSELTQRLTQQLPAEHTEFPEHQMSQVFNDYILIPQ